jgi:hypothetical protein
MVSIRAQAISVSSRHSLFEERTIDLVSVSSLASAILASLQTSIFQVNNVSLESI